MFRHISLLRFAPEATGTQREAVLDGLAGLPAAIPQIRSYRFGTDAGLAEGNFDVAIVADFVTEADYRVYASHPVHVELIEHTIRPILADRAAVQHELPTR